MRYKKSPGLHYYDDELILVRIDYKREFLNSILSRSAAARYFAINMNGYKLFKNFSTENSYLANTLRVADQERILWSMKAVDTFLSDIAKVTNSQKAIFIIDADRAGIYENKLDGDAYFSVMRSYLINETQKKNNMFVIDLHPIFAKSYSLDDQKFEFPLDYHWNPQGHSTVAKEIAKLVKAF